MEWLFILGLGLAVAALTGRLRIVERKIAELQAQVLTASAFREAEAKHTFVDHDQVREDPTGGTPALKFEPSDEALESLPSAGAAGGEEPPQDVEPRPALARPSIDFEELFGRRLPIWAGGVALAVAGVFLVRYSIERGLITPLLRVVIAFAFGIGLLAGAEWAYRARDRVSDPRVGQALAGAGLATLYAAFYLAGTQYGLIGQTLAFLGLATVTAGAIGLSYRFGFPSAVLGLVGGFAAPALLGGEDANLPLLALYLGLVTVGLALSGRRQQRPWLGIAALIGGLGWGAVLLAAGRFGTSEVVALGLYFVVLGAVLPSLAEAPRFARWLRLAAALAASLQLALLVDSAGYSLLVWSLYLLLGAALAALGWRKPELREASALAALVALILLAQWPGAEPTTFALAAAGLAAVFALIPLMHVWRGAEASNDPWQLAGSVYGVGLVAFLTFGDITTDRSEPFLAFGIATLAIIPGAAASRVHASPDTAPLALFGATAAALLAGAGLLVTPAWLAPILIAPLGAGLLAAFDRRREMPLRGVLAGACIAAALPLLLHTRSEGELLRLFGTGGRGFDAIGGMRWLAPAALAAAFAWREPHETRRRLGEAGAVVLLYGALAQLLPRELLSWSAAALAIAANRALPARRAAAWAALALAAAWTLAPLARWLNAGLGSLHGLPVFVTALPAPSAVTLYLAPAALALALVRLPRVRRIEAAVAPAIGLVAAHILFKQLFAIADASGFVARGLAERTLWEALLLGAAIAALRIRPLSLALAAAALAHFSLYTGLLHNPLWSTQAVGGLPIFNLAFAAYALAMAAALWLRRQTEPRLAPVWDGGVMLLASIGVLTLLRQAFAGSLLTAVPMGQAEDLLRSLTGILLALVFLWLGSRRRERSWRLGSLAIMLVAVAKVFLVDAAGLDGLLRVASFMALGFSLIGIGWVYARQLRTAVAR
ncbi:DUF2339 domain-containing protein [Qipengyuania sediminis]|uniref:DUF2339 domain-containing protein n=1 Tax=Qipengyuania sediminis TaxID=1532023 RepID=UPI00105A177E|nr:DUF2339 domain-containing protein [Qipengyuania sediminis]